MSPDIDMTCPICHKLSLDSNTDNDDVEVVVCHRVCIDKSREGDYYHR